MYSESWELFEVPVFPIGSLRYIHCNSCEAAWDSPIIKGDLLAAYREKSKEKKADARDVFLKVLMAPLLWIIGIGSIIGLLVTMNNISANRQKTFLLSPKLGDFYQVLDENKWTTFLKVIDIDSSRVGCFFANYSFKGSDSEIGPKRLNNMENPWSTDTVFYSLEDRKELVRNGHLKKVIRPSATLIWQEP